MYAIFSVRKLMIISQISDINFQIMQLTQNRLNITTLGGVVGDGCVTSQEYNSQSPYIQYGVNQMIGEADAAMQTSGQPFIQQMADQSIWFDEGYLQGIQAKMNAAEKEIDMKIKQLETKLAALQQEYESVQKGEEAGIKMSTPKYA